MVGGPNYPIHPVHTAPYKRNDLEMRWTGQIPPIYPIYHVHTAPYKMTDLEMWWAAQFPLSTLSTLSTLPLQED